ncbi:MAG: D-alanyl-D-alanine dipeptidase [Proteobacteria bacterium]|nr:D-alanyl-D-alanine dipeptidase [Pseudomonadota bacterium]
MKNLVEITKEKFDVILDLRYASKNNVCGQKLYNSANCYLHEAAIELLQKAIKSAKNLGLKIKIFDGFRPLEVQQFMFDKFSANDPEGGFVSNPDGGVIPHCRGVAVDLTLSDQLGKELDMGTDFDEFSDLAFHNCEKISFEARRNRLILLGIMTSAGWDFYSKEWWHYQLFNPREYDVVKASKDLIAI